MFHILSFNVLTHDGLDTDHTNLFVFPQQVYDTPLTDIFCLLVLCPDGRKVSLQIIPQSFHVIW
jgi:hypothetical protein